MMLLPRQTFVSALVVLAGCGGRPTPPPPAPNVRPDALQTVSGRVALIAAEGKGAGDLHLVADPGTRYRLADGDVARMFRLHPELRDRPVRLAGKVDPGSNTLRVESVRTVNSGQDFAVDFWCEVCQISLNYPGVCVCCGDETVLRERPVP
jgi:hypothetical protein